MALPATFAFTGTDNTALTTHDARFSMAMGASSNVVINSGLCQPNGGSDGRARLSGETFNDNQYCIGTYNPKSATTNYVEIYGRMNGTGNTMYWFYLQAGTGEFGKQVSGSNTTFTSSITGTTNDTFEIRCDGTTISLLKNGVTASTQTDSGVTTGIPAIGGYGYSSSIEHGWDAWEAGNLGAAAATSIVFRPGPRGWAGIIVR